MGLLRTSGMAGNDKSRVDGLMIGTDVLLDKTTCKSSSSTLSPETGPAELVVELRA